MRKLSLKQKKWLKHYILTGNKTEASRLAEYKATSDDSFSSIGHQNFRKLQPEIKKYLDEHGLTTEVILMKIVAGMNATQTKFFQKDGLVVTEKTVVAWNVQHKFCNLAAEIRGLKQSEFESRITALEQYVQQKGNR